MPPALVERVDSGNVISGGCGTYHACRSGAALGAAQIVLDRQVLNTHYTDHGQLFELLGVNDDKIKEIIKKKGKDANERTSDILLAKKGLRERFKTLPTDASDQQLRWFVFFLFNTLFVFCIFNNVLTF